MSSSAVAKLGYCNGLLDPEMPVFYLKNRLFARLRRFPEWGIRSCTNVPGDLVASVEQFLR
jgi:hypothetical protein